MQRFNENGVPTEAAKRDEQELQQVFSGYTGVDADYVHAGREALEKFWDWKFGIRIHWGPYAITGNAGGGWSLQPNHNGDPDYREQYEQIAHWWNPNRFDAAGWCDLFQRGGAKYFTFTTKHHDGFSMFDTRTKVKKRRAHTGADAGKIIDCDLHYSIMETPFQRDVVKELTDAARERDLGIGLYFSHIDWFDSDFRMDRYPYQPDEGYTRETDPEGFERMINRHREQLKEICSNYGKVDLLSLDIGFPGGEERHYQGLGTKHGLRDDLIETIKIIRRLQPEMLMRHRGIGEYGDYKTPEKRIPEDAEIMAGGFDMPWQVIYPGIKKASHMWQDDYKPVSWILENLIDITAKGGTFQLGYGPLPDGTWPSAVVRRLTRIGDWLGINGEGIYCTRPWKTFKEGENVRYTQSKDGKYVYAFLLDWPAMPFVPGEIRLETVRAKSGTPVEMLGLDHEFRYQQDENALRIEIPDWLQNPDNRPGEESFYCFKIQVE